MRHGSYPFTDTDSLHVESEGCTRRAFVSVIAGLGLGALLADRQAAAQPGPAGEKPIRIDVHHHVCSPGFIAEISGRAA